MKITRTDIDAAVEDNILSTEQADNLFNFLKDRPSVGPSFDFTHVLYYLGGMIAIGAMTLFMNLGWESFGGWGVFVIALVYGVIGLKLTKVFQSRGYAIPAGICAVFAVGMTPLAIYGLQQALGFWPDDSVYRDYHRYIKWHWIYMELGTLAAGMVVAWRYQYPFLIMPIAVTLWYMSMDLAPMLAGMDRPDYEFRALVSMYFGLLMVFLAFWVDIRARHTADYAFWLYLFGVMAFWGGMSMQHSDSELNKFIYFCINLVMIGIGVIVVRRVFVIFGALGGSFYLGHLASSVFRDSWLFPVSLTAIGLLIIYLGIFWQRHEKALTQKMQSLLPNALRELLRSKVDS